VIAYGIESILFCCFTHYCEICMLKCLGHPYVKAFLIKLDIYNQDICIWSVHG
jgi:hypothetical protein